MQPTTVRLRGLLALLPAAALASTVEVPSSGSIQEAVNSCPSEGCEIVLTGTDYSLPREIWIEGKNDLVLRRSDVLARQGVRPRLHLASGVSPFDAAGTAANPSDSLRPAGWKRWPRTGTSSHAAGGAGDSINPWSSQGFQFNGQIVVYRSSGVVLEGLEIDGGNPLVLRNKGIWDDKYDVLFGNVGVNLMRSGRSVVRDCDIHGFLADLYVNGRNGNGAFCDSTCRAGIRIGLDGTAPYSTGDHLVERNRLHDSHWAIFDEAEWDMGSTFRFNKAWNLASLWTGSSSDTLGLDANNMLGGWMALKDVMGPIHHIHNNTAVTGVLLAHSYLRAGTEHLVYNNLVSENVPPASRQSIVNDRNLLTYAGRWLWNNTFELGAADSLYQFATLNSAQIQDSAACASIQQTTPCFATLDAPSRYRSSIPNTSVPNYWSASTGANVPVVFQSRTYPAYQANSVELFPGGGRFATAGRSTTSRTGAMAVVDHDLLWLAQIPFGSTTPSSEQFLVPQWDSGSAASSIAGKGWTHSGWQPSNSLNSLPDVGSDQRAGLPERILSLRDQLPLLSVGKNLIVPISLRDSTHWSDLRLESAEVWFDGSRSSFSALLQQNPVVVPMEDKPAVAPVGSGSLTSGSHLVLALDSKPTSDTLVRVHLVVSAWSDSLGGRRTSQIAAFRGFPAAGSAASIQGGKAAPIRLGLVRQPNALRISLPSSPKAEIEILGADGRPLWSGEVAASNGTALVPSAGLPSGAWIVRARSGGFRLQGIVAGF